MRSIVPVRCEAANDGERRVASGEWIVERVENGHPICGTSKRREQFSKPEQPLQPYSHHSLPVKIEPEASVNERHDR